LHGNPGLTGYASNSPITTANAASLGVGWMTNLYGAVLGSPVVSYRRHIKMTLAYVGTENGYMYAVNVETGTVVWSVWLAGQVRGTPVVSDGAVYVATAPTGRIYKINADTGAVGCSLVTPTGIDASAIVVIPPGGKPTYYVGELSGGSNNGPVIAMNTTDCHVEWSFAGYPVASGTNGEWAPLSYAVDANGEPLILFGTSDPDEAIYALDAVTGALVWRYSTYIVAGDWDIGAGVTVSPPGANGFADGMAYVPTKYGFIYGLDLTTGKEVWSYQFDTQPAAGQTGISTPALDGTNLVFGYSSGVDDVDAITGKLIWEYVNPTDAEVLSSPAILGAAGDQVVAFGDASGYFRVLSLATGAELYSYQTNGYITASPAVTDGNLLMGSTDGFLYDFVVGGGNEASLPTTTITSPSAGSSLPNPNGDVDIAGNSTDLTGVSGVEVGIEESGPQGPWWDAATHSWSPGPVGNPATLATPGATSSTWSFELPVAAAGAVFQVVANAQSGAGQSTDPAAESQFSVSYSTSGPYIHLSASYAAPGSRISATGGGFADGERVAVSTNGRTLTTATASRSGKLTASSLNLPSNSPFGVASVIATGETSGRTTSAALYITNTWAQDGDTPTREAGETHDFVLNSVITPGHGVFIKLAWSLDAGSAVNTSPAIVDGMAYAGDDAGDLIATDIHNGAVLWTWDTPSGAAIEGSPAVDPATGLVFVGANDGNLYAISSASGTLAWTASVGGDVTAPAYANGNVYASSSSGAVDSFVEATGASSWNSSVAAPATEVALDGSTGQVFVGDGSGDLIALSATSGSNQWSDSTGAPIGGSPMVWRGLVYVGSGDDELAVVESSGAAQWSFNAGSAVDCAAAVEKNVVFVGTAAGMMYQLRSTTGRKHAGIQLPGGAVVGVGATSRLIVVETSGGDAEAIRFDNILAWQQQVSSSLSTSPVIVNGTVYIGTPSFDLDTFTPWGDPPA
jgi:outer membrane protein assembly factor BamB